jgi:hypothetical protein
VPVWLRILANQSHSRHEVKQSVVMLVGSREKPPSERIWQAVVVVIPPAEAVPSSQRYGGVLLPKDQRRWADLEKRFERILAEPGRSRPCSNRANCLTAFSLRPTSHLSVGEATVRNVQNHAPTGITPDDLHRLTASARAWATWLKTSKPALPW